MRAQRFGWAMVIAGCGGSGGSNADAPVAVDTAPIDDGRTIDAPSQCAARPANLVSWWPGDGNANDVVGANEGTLVGGTYAAGKVGQAFRFSGSTHYVNVSDSADLDFTTQLSVEAWVYPADSGGGRIVDKITPGGSDGYYFDLYFSNVRFNVGSSGVLLSNNTATAQMWTHVAVTYDGATMRVYVNGVLDGELATTTAIPTNNLPLTFGTRSDHNASFLNGTVDEISLYGRALSGGEIQAIYAAGARGKCP